MRSFKEVRPHQFAPLFWPAPAAAESPPMAEPAEEQAPPPLPDLTELVAAARAEGFQAGYRDGLRRAQAEQAETIRALAALVNGAVQENRALIRALEKEAVTLCLAIATKVVERELQTDPSLVADVLHGAFVELAGAVAVRVRVHPADYDLLSARWAELCEAVHVGEPELVADVAIGRGGCVIETRTGQVDAQLETKLGQIRTQLVALLEGDPL